MESWQGHGSQETRDCKCKDFKIGKWEVESVRKILPGSVPLSPSAHGKWRDGNSSRDSTYHRGNLPRCWWVGPGPLVSLTGEKPGSSMFEAKATLGTPPAYNGPGVLCCYTGIQIPYRTTLKDVAFDWVSICLLLKSDSTLLHGRLLGRCVSPDPGRAPMPPRMLGLEGWTPQLCLHLRWAHKSPRVSGHGVGSHASMCP
jgi:hypothetical protein